MLVCTLAAVCIEVTVITIGTDGHISGVVLLLADERGVAESRVVVPGSIVVALNDRLGVTDGTEDIPLEVRFSDTVGAADGISVRLPVGKEKVVVEFEDTVRLPMDAMLKPDSEVVVVVFSNGGGNTLETGVGELVVALIDGVGKPEENAGALVDIGRVELADGAKV